MKAIVYTQFGSPEVLHLAEVEKPAPKDNEILVKVHAAPVNFGDLTARNFNKITGSEFPMPLPLLLPARMHFGFNQPKINILGSEFSGIVEAVGKDASRFKAGDPVMGYLGQRMGTYAEYVCVPEARPVALKPSNLSYAQAAAIPYGAIMASGLLRKGNLQRGHKVLIIGASGGIGTAAVQLARFYGAQVTGVCGTPRLEYVKSLGAERVIDYTQEDFSQNGETYDLILDILGKSSFSHCRQSLKENGIYLLASFKVKPLVQMLATSLSGGKRVVCALVSESTEPLVFIKGLAEEGKFKAIIDRCYPMEQAADAHRYAESGFKKGNVIIDMEHSDIL